VSIIRKAFREAGGRQLRRWTAYNAVGALGIAVQLGTLMLLVRVAGWQYLWATAAAVEAAVLHNFVWHQRWTWRDRPAASWRSRASRFARFQMFNGFISLCGNLLLMRIFNAIPGVNPILANVAAISACAALNFTASNVAVFRPVASVLAMGLLSTAPAILAAQSPGALAGWNSYQSSLDALYSASASAPAFFAQDRDAGHAGWRDTLRSGAITLSQVDAPSITGGRIHHWIGAVFVPGTTVDAVVRKLEQHAGRESESYEDVTASKLLSREGDTFRIFMKLRRTTVMTVTYNTEHTVEYRRIAPGRSSARSVATHVAELADAGTPREREKPAGQDNGFLWRLAAYWRYEAWQNGVIVECESVSLSRDIPTLLRPIARPIVDRVARESLEQTLHALRGIAG
jgi:putative flippase GtrA